MGALELERLKRIKEVCKKTGWPEEGHYKITENGKTRWVLVTISFYPKTTWWIEEAGDDVVSEPIKGTRRPLDDATRKKLETWL